MFSKACEYGIKASVYVALQSLQNRRVSLNEIASEIGSPSAYTAKILYQLAKSGILISSKGPTGGFQILNDQIGRIKLSDIVFAIDGDSIYEGCGMGLEKCNAAKPCPVHEKFVIIRQELKEMLVNTSLLELTGGLEDGLTYLKR